VESLLLQKQYGEAHKASIKLTNRMLDRLGTGAEASSLLAKVVSLRGQAEEGLGNTDDAIWYRQVAVVLDPNISLPPDEKTLPAPIDALSLPAAPSTTAALPKMEAPQSTRRRMPEKPGIVNAMGEAIVVVAVVIDVTGTVRQPSIVSSPAPSVSYAALEAVKQWRFRPGKVDGKPVPVIFHLTFNFH
jgi:TonB family protein